MAALEAALLFDSVVYNERRTSDKSQHFPMTLRMLVSEITVFTAKELPFAIRDAHLRATSTSMTSWLWAHASRS